MKVTIMSAAPDLVRSEQSGDWTYTWDSIRVLVDRRFPDESALAIGIHELVEAFLCRKRGIKDEDVVAFDETYEANRKEGKHSETDEPGDDPHAPYREEHMAATHVERAVCHALDISWLTHEKAVQALAEGHQKNGVL